MIELLSKEVQMANKRTPAETRWGFGEPDTPDIGSSNDESPTREIKRPSGRKTKTSAGAT